MPGAEAMTAFTPEADARLADYLRQVRAALAAAPDVDPAEVEADIREHVETEFAGAGGPVGLGELEAVLARLGPPAAWAGGVEAARPVWEQVGAGARAVRDGLRQTARGVVRGSGRVAGVLWRGPEDWRLAYLTFAAFVLFLLSFLRLNQAGPALVFPPLFAAYLLGRAAVAFARDAGVPLGARRWLVYPPLVLVSLPFLVGTLAFPMGAGVTAGRVTAEVVEESKRWPARGPGDVPFVLEAFPGLPNVKPVQTGVAAGVGAAAFGYVVLGGLLWAFPGAARAVFVPFLAGITRRFGRRLFVTAFAVLVAWGVAAYPVVGRILAGPAPLVVLTDKVSAEPPARRGTFSRPRTTTLTPAAPNATLETLPKPTVRR